MLPASPESGRRSAASSFPSSVSSDARASIFLSCRATRSETERMRSASSALSYTSPSRSSTGDCSKGYPPEEEEEDDDASAPSPPRETSELDDGSDGSNPRASSPRTGRRSFP